MNRAIKDAEKGKKITYTKVKKRVTVQAFRSDFFE